MAKGPVYSEEYNERLAKTAPESPKGRGKARRKPAKVQTGREGTANAATPGGIPKRK